MLLTPFMLSLDLVFRFFKNRATHVLVNFVAPTKQLPTTDNQRWCRVVDYRILNLQFTYLQFRIKFAFIEIEVLFGHKFRKSVFYRSISMLA